jgi:hypothetical protein
MVPMMVVAVNRAVRPPVVMIPGVDAKDTVHATCSTANGTADDSANRTRGPASLRGAPLQFLRKHPEHDPRQGSQGKTRQQHILAA